MTTAATVNAIPYYNNERYFSIKVVRFLDLNYSLVASVHSLIPSTRRNSIKSLDKVHRLPDLPSNHESPIQHLFLASVANYRFYRPGPRQSLRSVFQRSSESKHGISRVPRAGHEYHKKRVPFSNG